MSISQVITDFTTYAIQIGGFMEMDRLYVQNRLLGMIGETTLEKTQVREVDRLPIELAEQLYQRAFENQKVGHDPVEKEQYITQLMDILTPPPSVVNAFFAQHYATDPKEATDYFYTLSQQNDYIKTKAIAKNIAFNSPSQYGELEITINLSKPEKDPKQIAKEKEAVQSDYPKCLLCMENEGYLGRVNHPARSNHRIIRMNLDGESWGLQYSPYAYYQEHCIFLSEIHRPMTISRKTFERLLQIVEIFPHYFAGSNADLPIVGGSILSHDHYQGGAHEFPMAKAAIKETIVLPLFQHIQAGIVDWPMSVIRLQGEDKQALVNAAEYILASWKLYSDEAVDIVAHTTQPHHTITPIARRRGAQFELDLVLRDNHTTAEFPEGVYHPHRDIQHIKKENIGLIEVMGLAILPPRLKQEMIEMHHYLLDEDHSLSEIHHKWAQEVKARRQEITKDNVERIVEEEIGAVFLRVLEDAGVFKDTPEGHAAFLRFVAQL
ncbi:MULTISPECIES: UDP-glucose--hexose-1-phosphate uridylyltransferase [Enterococcus]|uniref:Galactose-1-phosphate uridylyltransferase n=1 Tax=Enterococcus sulfureus ATCC 49903 TaxID=1140003 RepID=S0KQV1_9ENTE|nr:UDP-glucose--hexose-1-phosphate uridylyltransferase [Enterococcus sulfureus]EOT47027.1 galactose-1-phosphate uridylyltransferase [Enterococcus sulfureus ATCC 49903]EOT83678.1 galactose-1-phosphate uridylyltransferase [Enterococcus sulfureus ATCC 49903]